MLHRYIIVLDRHDDDDHVNVKGEGYYGPARTDVEGITQVAAEIQEAMNVSGSIAGFFNVVARAEAKPDSAMTIGVAYEGPFNPPPAESMEGALAWRFTKRHNHDNTRWEPTGWEIIKADGILTVDYTTHIATRDSIIYAP